MWSLLQSDLRIIFNYWSCLQEGACLRSFFKRRNLMQKSPCKVSKLLMRLSLMTLQPHVSKSDTSRSGRAARHPLKMMCKHPSKFSVMFTSGLDEAMWNHHVRQNPLEEVLKFQLVLFYKVNIQNRHFHQSEKCSFLLMSPSTHERSQHFWCPQRNAE